MAYQLLTPQPDLRDEALDYDDIGPGLYPDETALILDEDIHVAVSVITKWLENNGGVSFKACARWINEDGSTHLCPNGQHVETWASYTATAMDVQNYHVTAISKDMLLLVIGEPTILTRDVPQADESILQVPVVDVNSEFKMNCSIQNAIQCVQDTTPDSPSNILGL